MNDEGKASKADISYVRDDFWATTSNKQLNFLQHVKSCLKMQGRAAIVVPDNVLFEGGAGETVRRELLKQCDVHTLLRLPTGSFYAQGVKANVLFFDRKPASEKPWTDKLWIYDFRTNQHFTLKTNPVKREHLDDFVACYNPENRHQRKESERFRAFTYDDLLKRDKVSLDIFWLKDDSLEDSANLPDPDVIASEIAEDLQAALDLLPLSRSTSKGETRMSAPMEITPDKRPLSSIIEAAYIGKLCLPNFQRDFVWSRDQVGDLLRSVLRRYFIGSLLLLRCDPKKPPFAPMFVRGGNAPQKEPRPDLLILDGQQRISSLLYALTAPDLSLKDSSQRRWLFVDLNAALADIDSEEIVFDRSPRDLDGLDQVEEQYRRRILPCTAIASPKKFLAWRDGLDDFLREHEPEHHKSFRTEWRDHWTTLVTDFQQFDIPLVELPLVGDTDSDAIGKVCAIFEKLNSTGVELSVYDLLTARLYRHGIRIHDLWRDACKKHKLLRQWSDGGKADAYKFGVMVLRTIALLRNLDAKPKTLINLSHVQFEND